MNQPLFPIFPLNIVLLPEEPVPLHIFEERYKTMIRECLNAKSRQAPGQEFGIVYAKGDEIEQVGCSARIVNVTRQYPDGRLDILVVGRRRFEILFTDEDAPYLRCGVDFFDDELGADTADDSPASAAIDLFRRALRQLHGSAEMPVHFPRPYRYLSYRMAASLPLELDFKQRLLSIRNESERLEELVRLMRFLTARLETIDKARKKAGGNGDVSPQLS